jgi:hypothetical protein
MTPSLLDPDVGDLGLRRPSLPRTRSEKLWTAPPTGVKGLMLAMLDDGIRSYLGPTGRLQSDAERWILDTRTWTPFSFAVVCETLGLAPDAARTVLQRLHTEACSARTAIGRLRPNVRPIRQQPPQAKEPRAGW